MEAVGKNDAAEELFDMLQAEDAYVPSRGRETEGKPQETGKRKGVRT